MIQIRELTKKFDENCVLSQISLDIPEGVMYGLLGTNGAGKTTLLKLLAGIMEADSGGIWIDRKEQEEGAKKRFAEKEKLFYLSDDPYYFPNASLNQMARFYAGQYPSMDQESVSFMAETLNLDPEQPIRTFSKGMKRQAFLLLALCARTKYLLCDEVFDGLDPIAVEVMKNLFRQEMKERRFTVIVASHKLHELEDICENIAILHKGGVVTSGDMKEQAGSIRKFQCVFRNAGDREELAGQLDLIRASLDGYFTTLIVREKAGEAERKIREKDPVFYGEVPMSLEEIFISEMEGKSYDIRKVLH